MSQRRKVKIRTTRDAAAEVNRLKQGYRKEGEWSLPQTCKHLSLAIRYSMQPAPERPDTQTWGQWLLLKIILTAGRIPEGAAAAKRINPADEEPESACDEFLGALDELDRFKGEFSPHPRFGKIGRKDYYRLHLIHCAHHFRFLIPTDSIAAAS